MAEFNQNLWAPWRMQYIRGLGTELTDEGCFLCRDWNEPDRDAEHHVLLRRRSTFLVMNRFPYTNGHLLVAHVRHVGDLTDLTDDELHEMMGLIRDAERALRATLNPQGFNIGYNIGACAGAGLPGHLHAHIVPRWSGDTNFMAVLDQTRVIPDALDTVYRELLSSLPGLL